MNKYEAMLIVKPDLAEEERKTLFNQISDAVAKYNGKVTAASVWSERKRLLFKIKKYQEGVYYLLNFSLDPLAVKDVRHAYTLNENILRVLITNAD